MGILDSNIPTLILGKAELAVAVASLLFNIKFAFILWCRVMAYVYAVYNFMSLCLAFSFSFSHFSSAALEIQKTENMTEKER